MARVVKKAIPRALTMKLSDPGMTPILKAGLGGLASSLRAMLRASNEDAPWPSRIPIGPGFATVESTQVTIEWGTGSPEEVLRSLFEFSFRIRAPHGIIDFPGTYERKSPELATSEALQSALRKTFLQHGLSAKKAGPVNPITVEIDDKRVTASIQPYAYYTHQKQWKSVVQVATDGVVRLSGWAYPGAAQRHIAFGGTGWSYSASEALCACFAIVGCLSFNDPNSKSGVLVIPEPTELVRFAEMRPQLTPRSVADAYVAGASDAVLLIQLELKMDQLASRARGSIGLIHGVTLRSTPWASQQKNRVSTVTVESRSDDMLDLYDDIVRTLPAKIHISAKSQNATDRSEFFVTTSALRGFVTENIALGRSWFCGFSTASVGPKLRRFLHYYRSKDNLGALFPEERSGLIAMLSHLEPAQRALVQSVHIALRRRFGTIANESGDVPATMKNRFNGEREKWRLAFSGSKTLEQIRGALSDLWSRGGPNRELQKHWEEVLPLLTTQHWQAARDLALVALASYHSNVDDDDDADSELVGDEQID